MFYNVKTKNKELKSLLIGFKPEFGNVNHIDILNALQKIDKENRKTGQKTDRVAERIDYEESHLVQTLRKIVDKPVNTVEN